MNESTLRKLFAIDGKVAVVTDSGNNSSVDVAPVLADAGAAVVIVADKDRAHINALAERINASGRKAVAIATDVEDEASVVALFDAVRQDFGGVDIVVNCAAMTGNGPLTEFTAVAWDDVMSVDLRSVFLCMREAIRQMVAGGHGGRIVNITTMGALHPVLNGNGAYGAARSGVMGLVRSAALDYVKHGILINCVLPGAVPGKVRFTSDTDLRARNGKLTGPGTDVDRRRPLGLGAPEDIAAAVLYLVGPSCGYMTGQSIILDGGFLIS